ncbi:alkaline phosphatase [Bacillus aquiflavi]|nr:alkaline phosphatase [Bacillus aquiflavi]
MVRICKLFIAIGLSVSMFFHYTQVSATSYPEVNNIQQEEPKVKNVIMMLGDGMGVGQLEIARLLEHGKEGSLFIETLPHVALMRTYSNNNFVTDSAAGGTGIATSVKTNNGMIGVKPNGKEVKSILDAFQHAGKKVGIISNNTVTDATPASFTGSTTDRWNGQEKIAREMLKNKYDVILGGGSIYFSPEKQKGIDLISKFKEEGYAFVHDKTSLKKVKNPERLLGLFHPTYMNYKLDYEQKKSNEPSLIEMTETALNVLSTNEKGFFLMVEGARIDHAAHAADATGVWKETIEFDNTVKATVNWAKKRDDTLVIVLADHETMGMAASEPMDIEGLKKIKASSEFIAHKLKIDKNTGNYPADNMKKILKQYAHIDISDDEVEQFNENVKRSSQVGIYPQYAVTWEIGSLIAAHYNVGVMSRDVRAKSNTTSGHSGNMVPIFAYGPSADRFDGVLDNTDISKMIGEISGVPFIKR